jgi:hypothetical protein
MPPPSSSVCPNLVGDSSGADVVNAAWPGGFDHVAREYSTLPANDHFEREIFSRGLSLPVAAPAMTFMYLSAGKAIRSRSALANVTGKAYMQ